MRKFKSFIGRNNFYNKNMKMIEKLYSRDKFPGLYEELTDKQIHDLLDKGLKIGYTIFPTAHFIKTIDDLTEDDIDYIVNSGLTVTDIRNMTISEWSNFSGWYKSKVNEFIVNFKDRYLSIIEPGVNFIENQLNLMIYDVEGLSGETVWSYKDEIPTYYDMDNDGNIDKLLYDSDDVSITYDKDSIQIDIDKDGDADVIIPLK
jgi:hypothetical protein